MSLRPNRFALDVLLEGTRPVSSTALHADIWNFVSNDPTLHGQPQQRVSFGLINPAYGAPVRELPRLRVYSTNPEFSAAFATQLLCTREIIIGRQHYHIAGQAAVRHLDAEYVDTRTPLLIRASSPNPDNPQRPFVRCVTHDDPFFHTRLQTVMRQKLWDCGFTNDDLPEGPLVTMIAARRGTMQIKEREVFLPGAIGRWQLHGSPEVRQCLLLSGLGVKTGMGFGFAVPAA